MSLLVGAKYGVSQVVNHKLNIMTTLTEFSSVSRVELLPESDKVSLVKIYLQDVKVWTPLSPTALDRRVKEWVRGILLLKVCRFQFQVGCCCCHIQQIAYCNLICLYRCPVGQTDYAYRICKQE